MSRTEIVKNRSASASRRPSRKASAGNPGTREAPSREQIELCAYEIWQRRGRPHGQDVEHWLQAERELAITSK